MQGLRCLKNNFWWSVIHAWVQCNSNLNITDDVVPMSHQEDQRLWNNCNIMYKGKALLFPKWIEAGLYKMGQLFNGSESFCTINEISNLVGASPNLWFEYNALYNALPRQWKYKSGSPQSTSVPQFWDQNIMSCVNKMMREKIVSLKYSRPYSASFWEKKFEIDFERGV